MPDSSGLPSIKPAQIPDDFNIYSGDFSIGAGLSSSFLLTIEAKEDFVPDSAYMEKTMIGFWVNDPSTSGAPYTTVQGFIVEDTSFTGTTTTSTSTTTTAAPVSNPIVAFENRPVTGGDGSFKHYFTVKNYCTNVVVELWVGAIFPSANPGSATEVYRGVPTGDDFNITSPLLPADQRRGDFTAAVSSQEAGTMSGTPFAVKIWAYVGASVFTSTYGFTGGTGSGDGGGDSS